MSYGNNQQINSPLLKRLIDEAPEKNFEQDPTTWVSLQDFHMDIKNNLEHLLNTRAPHLNWPKHLQALDQSPLNYGLHDFMHSYFGNKEAQQQLCQHITAAINCFEPRLSDVRVDIIDGDLEKERLLKLRIEAMINIKPAPASAVFESCVDVTKQNFAFE